METTSGRITRVGAPVASPGCCGICGTSSHVDGFAEANLNFEFYGTFILCKTCVGDYARVFDFMAPEDARNLLAILAKQDAELAILRKAILGLESAVDGLTSVRNLQRDSVDNDGGSVLHAVVAAEPVSDSVEGYADSGAQVELPFDESSDEPRPNDVRNTGSADLDDLLS